MQKEVEKKAIKMAHHSSKSHYLLSSVATLFSFLLIILGIVTLILIQKPIRESQELRQQASTATGQVTVKTNTSNTITKGQPATVTFSVNTHGVQTDGVQLIFDLIGSGIEDINVGLVDNSGLSAAYQEVKATSLGSRVELLTVPVGGMQTSFATTTDKDFLRLTFTPTLEGDITIKFSTEDSISTVHNSDPPEDELKNLPDVNITVTTPVVTPSPSASPTVSPSPSVSPSPDTGTGGNQLKGCNEECSSSKECPNNYGCYDISGTGRCRLATNVSSTTCQTPPDRGISRACNEYCADSRECRTGFTCFYNRCRLPVNPDSTTCSQPTQQVTQTITQGCNKSCASNRDCATNLRCFNGSCRLATNPGSLTCTAATVPSGSISTQKGQNLPPVEPDFPASSISPSSSPGVTQPSVSPFIRPSAPSTAPLIEAETEPLFPEEQTALDAVVENLRQRGVTFPLAMIVSGLVILGLVLLLILIRSLSHRAKPTQTVYKQSGQDQQYLQELQNKIKTFEQPPRPPQPTSTAPMTPPPSPIKPAVPSMAPPPNVQRPQPPFQPTQVVRPVVPTPPAPPTPQVNRPIPPAPTAGSTMLERLKQKGIATPGTNNQNS